MAQSVQKKRGLGRGLSDLGLNELLTDRPVSVAKAPPQGQRLPVERLHAGRYQPRRIFDETSLQELADSISAQGIIQPIVVRPAADQFEIIAGERRWRAAQLVGLDTVPVIIRDVSDDDAIAMALIENIQREDLNVIEEAQALKRLIDEFNMTHKAIAKTIGKSRSAVTNTLRLLDLEHRIRTMLERGDLEMGHARALLTLPLQNQYELGKQIVAKALSVRETERLIQRAQRTPSQPRIIAAEDANLVRLQALLADKLGAAIKIKQFANGSGQLVINFHSVDELEGILEHIQ